MPPNDTVNKSQKGPSGGVHTKPLYGRGGGRRKKKKLYIPKKKKKNTNEAERQEEQRQEYDDDSRDCDCDCDNKFLPLDTVSEHVLLRVYAERERGGLVGERNSQIPHKTNTQAATP